MLMLVTDFPMLDIRLVDGGDSAHHHSINGIDRSISDISDTWAVAGYPTVLLFKGDRMVGRLGSPADHGVLIELVKTKLGILPTANATTVAASEALVVAMERCSTALNEAVRDGDANRAALALQMVRVLSWYSNGNEEGQPGGIAFLWAYLYCLAVCVFLFYESKRRHTAAVAEAGVVPAR